jgi:hypothetical protein
MQENRMKNQHIGASLVVAVVAALLATNAQAQRSGQSAKISVGTVTATERVDLRSTAGRSAIVGGVVGYHATSSSKSSSRKWRNAAIGSAAMAGAKRAGEGDLTGVMYTVALVDGNRMQIISDQTQIVSGDCVTVEQVGDNANIRRADPALCEPETQAVMPDLEDELVEEAEECYAAKQELLAADSDEAAELATRKVRVLCNG